ncbi:MAG: competence protein CoiA [Gammaproteobacteria bacterium]
MRFARVNGQHIEAFLGASGECPGCGSLLISKCGKKRVWHWAHKGVGFCDPWWENESDWHRAWKDQFPVDWQEVVHDAADGQRHIADVKTATGWVLEFQHSALSSEERGSREEFYEALVWVVDGLRRKRDARQFFGVYRNGEKSADPQSTKCRISMPKGALFEDWRQSRAHVFFDFGEQTRIWWLYPGSDAVRAYVQAVSRSEFIRAQRERTADNSTRFDFLVQNFSAFVAKFEKPPPAPRPSRRTGAPGAPRPVRINVRCFRL